MAGKARRDPTDVTPEQAKFVWESFGKPSLRQVAGAFAAVNRPIDFRLLSKWRNNGWRRGKDEAPASRAKAAVDRLDVAIPALTNNPATRVDDFVEPTNRRKLAQTAFGFGAGVPSDLNVEIDVLRQTLIGASDEGLMRAEAREMKITNIILQRVIQRRAEELIMDNTSGLSEVIEALGQYPAGSNECYDKMITYRERAAQVIDGTSPINDHIPRPEDLRDPLQAAIAEMEAESEKDD